MSRSLRWVSPMIPLLALLWAGPAAAWRTGSCNHQDVRWAADRVPLEVMPCSAPPGSHRSGDLLAGIDGWNSVPGTAARFVPRVGQPRCRIDVNHHSELGYVDPARIDGARGITRLVYDGVCQSPRPGQTWPTAPRIIETDVVIADFAHDVSGPPQVCDRLSRSAPLRRALILHELGHAFGLRHEDDVMAVMNTSASGGRYCGVRAMEPHPDDRAGVRRIYPARGGAAVRDVAAISFYLTEPNYTREVLPGGYYQVCAGEPLAVRWAVANMGTVDARTQVRWFVSDNDIISRNDIPVGTIEDVLVPAGGFRSEEAMLEVPEMPSGPGIPQGPWWLGFVVDADGPGFELPASNDTTYTELRLWALAPEECGGRP